MISCSPNPTEIRTKPTTKPTLDLEDPKPLNMQRYPLYAIAEENALHKIKQDGMLIATTKDGYKSMMTNLKRLQDYITELKTSLKEYRAYYESEEHTDN